MVLDLPPKRTAIIGMSGSGKTVWAFQWLDQIDTRKAQVIYIDTTNVSRRKAWASKFLPLVATSIKEVQQQLWTNGKAIYCPPTRPEIEDLVAWVLAWKRNATTPEPIWIFCDEVHLYSERHLYPNVTELFTTGRNFDVTGVAITQNLPQVANRSIIGNCWYKVLFSIDDDGILSLRRNYSVVVPPHVLEHVNVDADKFETERQVFNAAIRGLKGTEWVLI